MASFELYGHTVHYTDAMVKEVDMLQHAINLAHEISNDVGKDYDGCKSIKSVMQSLPTIQAKHYRDAAKQYLKLIRAAGVCGYDYSAEDFLSDYFLTNSSLDEVHGAIIDAYNSLSQEKIAAEMHRDMRKATRSRVIGGGFGIGGAVKGMLIAGGINALSGAAHGLFNFADGIVTNAGIESKMGNLYNKARTPVVEAAFNDVLGMLDFSLEAINYRYLLSYEGRASKIMRAIDGGEVPQRDVSREIVRILELEPYSEDSYLFAMARLGDSNGELIRLAQFFHQDTFLARLEAKKREQEEQERKRQEALRQEEYRKEIERRNQEAEERWLKEKLEKEKQREQYRKQEIGGVSGYGYILYSINFDEAQNYGVSYGYFDNVTYGYEEVFKEAGELISYIPVDEVPLFCFPYKRDNKGEIENDFLMLTTRGLHVKQRKGDQDSWFIPYENMRGYSKSDKIYFWKNVLLKNGVELVTKKEFELELPFLASFDFSRVVKLLKLFRFAYLRETAWDIQEIINNRMIKIVQLYANQSKFGYYYTFTPGYMDAFTQAFTNYVLASGDFSHIGSGDFNQI